RRLRAAHQPAGARGNLALGAAIAGATACPQPAASPPAGAAPAYRAAGAGRTSRRGAPSCSPSASLPRDPVDRDPWPLSLSCLVGLARFSRVAAPASFSPPLGRPLVEERIHPLAEILAHIAH